jgi:phosphopantetheine adenylyltransferase
MYIVTIIMAQFIRFIAASEHLIKLVDWMGQILSKNLISLEMLVVVMELQLNGVLVNEQRLEVGILMMQAGEYLT